MATRVTAIQLASWVLTRILSGQLSIFSQEATY